MSESATRPALESGISFDTLLRYNELETARWREWFKNAPPSVLDISAGDPAVWMENVRMLLFHIFLVEWIYAKTLHGRGWDGWESLDLARWRVCDRGRSPAAVALIRGIGHQ